MQDVGLIVDQRQRLEHRAVEEGEALALVPAPAVDRGAVVIELIIDKIEGHAVELEHLDAAILPSPAEIDVEIGQVFHLFTPLRRDIPVKRQDHADLSAQFFQLLGQRAGHIRQPAGLDKRNTFRDCKKDSSTHIPAFLKSKKEIKSVRSPRFSQSRQDSSPGRRCGGRA